jgi:TPR repeat protein
MIAYILGKYAIAYEITWHFTAFAAYFEGSGVRKDQTEAVVWLRKSAEQGLSFAQAELGVAYLLGQGTPKDERQALVWLRKAADQPGKPAGDAGRAERI